MRRFASMGARLLPRLTDDHPEPELSRYLARSFSVEGVREAVSQTDVSIFLVEESSGAPIAYAYLRASPEPPPASEAFAPLRSFGSSRRASQGAASGFAQDAC